MRQPFAVDAASLGGLREAGFTVLNLANNHVLDRGVEGLEATVRGGRGHWYSSRWGPRASRPTLLAWSEPTSMASASAGSVRRGRSSPNIATGPQIRELDEAN